MSQLLIHAGGWEATKADLASVPVPDATPSYMPVPYGRFVEEVELHVPRFALRIVSAAFALARDGKQMFGVLTCENGHRDPGYALAIGLRNSYDRSLATELVAGTRVFCCDNLAFHGEVHMRRKHTVHVFRDLPDLIYRMLSQVQIVKGRTDREIARMRERELAEIDVDHLLMAAVRRNALPASLIPRTLEVYDHPQYSEFEPRTAWSLWNALTEVQKTRSPRQQMEESLRVTQVFREVLQL